MSIIAVLTVFSSYLRLEGRACVHQAPLHCDSLATSPVAEKFLRGGDKNRQGEPKSETCAQLEGGCFTYGHAR